MIDDIYTTGSTFDSCSRVLKSGGAGMVYVLTFAAGGNVAPKDRL
ncbi:MAG: ComF family protein [Anaerovoracaceae bacterium]